MINVSHLINQYPQLLHAYINHNPTQDLLGLCSEEDPKKDHLVFISKPHNFPKATKAQVGALVVPESHKDMIPESTELNVITASNSRVALAVLSTEVFGLNKLKHQFADLDINALKQKAFIHPSAQVHETALIGPFAFVGPETIIKENVVVGAGAHIDSRSIIGANSEIHPKAYIGHGTHLGAHCAVYPHAGVGVEGFGYGSNPQTGQHFPINHQGTVHIHDSVHIGAGTQIDRGTFGFTEIGEHTKIDNLCHIAHNCKIGKSCLITAGFKVAGSTTIGDLFVTGGNVTVTGHIRICDQVNLAAMSVVHKSIEKPGAYYGYPLKPIKEGLKNNAAFGNLHKIKKDLNRVLKHLNLNQSSS